MRMVLLFVYGSLQQGLWNNFHLDNAMFVCLVKTIDKYTLRTSNHVIPKVHPNEKRYHIYGELYDIPIEELKKVDQHEGLDSGFYTRESIEVIANGGRTYTAWIYFSKVVENGDVVVEHGNYKNYILGVTGAQKFIKRAQVEKFNTY